MCAADTQADTNGPVKIAAALAVTEKHGLSFMPRGRLELALRRPLVRAVDNREPNGR